MPTVARPTPLSYPTPPTEVRHGDGNRPRSLLTSDAGESVDVKTARSKRERGRTLRKTSHENAGNCRNADFFVVFPSKCDDANVGPPLSQTRDSPRSCERSLATVARRWCSGWVTLHAASVATQTERCFQIRTYSGRRIGNGNTAHQLPIASRPPRARLVGERDSLAEESRS